MAAVPSAASWNKAGRDRLGGGSVTGTLHEASEGGLSSCRACNPILISPGITDVEREECLANTIGKPFEALDRSKKQRVYSNTAQKSPTSLVNTSRVTVAVIGWRALPFSLR